MHVDLHNKSSSQYDRVTIDSLDESQHVGDAPDEMADADNSVDEPEHEHGPLLKQECKSTEYVFKMSRCQKKRCLTRIVLRKVKTTADDQHAPLVTHPFLTTACMQSEPLTCPTTIRSCAEDMCSWRRWRRRRPKKFFGQAFRAPWWRYHVRSVACHWTCWKPLHASPDTGHYGKYYDTGDTQQSVWHDGIASHCPL